MLHENGRYSVNIKPRDLVQISKDRHCYCASFDVRSFSVACILSKKELFSWDMLVQVEYLVGKLKDWKFTLKLGFWILETFIIIQKVAQKSGKAFWVSWSRSSWSFRHSKICPLGQLYPFCSIFNYQGMVVPPANNTILSSRQNQSFRHFELQYLPNSNKIILLVLFLLLG